MSTVKTAAIAVCILSSAAMLSAAEPEVTVKLQRTSIYEGESTVYTVTVNNVEEPNPPDLSGFDEFKVESLGERSLNSRSVSIYNGRRTETIRYGRAYNYRLTPLRSGIVRVPVPVVEVDGRTIRGRELHVEVVAPQQQDLVVMQIEAEPKAVYPLQPFTVTLSLLVKGLPAPNEKVDPAMVRSFPRQLSIPWATDDGLPDGLKPQVPWQRWLGSLRSNSGVGFTVNGLSQRGAFFSFMDERSSMLNFCPKPRKVNRFDEDGAETEYWRYDFKRTFVPMQIGRYEFGPLSFKGKIATGANARGGALGEGVYAIAPAIGVTCKDVPEAGRPDCYIGAVGDFRLAGDLTPRTGKVGDPMTLTLTISGKGTLADARPPDLARVAEIAENFKIYEATEESKDEQRQFTYSLRPKRDGIEEFPSVPVAYFDVEEEKYVTLQTDPIDIRISKAARLTGNQIVAARRGSATNGDDVEVQHEGLFHNISDPSAVGDERVRPGRWMAALAAMGGIYAVVAGVTRQVRRRSGDTALRRRRRAAATAKARLQAARADLQAGRLREGADGIRTAVAGLVADMIDLPDGGLTPREIEDKLRSLDVQPQLIERLNALLETCDDARYGDRDGLTDNFAGEAEDLLRALKKELKSKRPRSE